MKKYKGEAVFELENTETGEKQTFTEHNTLSCLLDDLFSENQLDGIIKNDFQLNKYFNQICLFDGKISNSKPALRKISRLLGDLEARINFLFNKFILKIKFLLRRFGHISL